MEQVFTDLAKDANSFMNAGRNWRFPRTPTYHFYELMKQKTKFHVEINFFLKNSMKNMPNSLNKSKVAYPNTFKLQKLLFSEVIIKNM